MLIYQIYKYLSWLWFSLCFPHKIFQLLWSGQAHYKCEFACRRFDVHVSLYWDWPFFLVESGGNIRHFHANRQRGYAPNKPHNNYQGNNDRMDRDRPKQQANGSSGPSVSPTASSNTNTSNSSPNNNMANRDGAKYSGGSTRRDDGFPRLVLAIIFLLFILTVFSLFHCWFHKVGFSKSFLVCFILYDCCLVLFVNAFCWNVCWTQEQWKYWIMFNAT